MTRSELHDVCSNKSRAESQVALTAYFATPDGVADLTKAPRIWQENGQARPMAVEDAVTALLEEVYGFE